MSISTRTTHWINDDSPNPNIHSPVVTLDPDDVDGLPIGINVQGDEGHLTWLACDQAIELAAVIARLLADEQPDPDPAAQAIELASVIARLLADEQPDPDPVAAHDIINDLFFKDEDGPPSYHGFEVGTVVEAKLTPDNARYVVVERDPSAEYGVDDAWVPVKMLDAEGNPEGTQYGLIPDCIRAAENADPVWSHPAEAEPNDYTSPIIAQGVDREEWNREALAEAIERDLAVTFTYQGEHDTYPHQRVVTPTEFVGDFAGESGERAVVAGDEDDDGAVKRFRLDRIASHALVLEAEVA